MKHYCSLLNRPIKSKIQEEFAKLKFALLIDLAIDIANEEHLRYSIAELQDMVAQELSSVNVDNVEKWMKFSDDYLKSIGKISSEDVKHTFTITYDGTMNVDAF